MPGEGGELSPVIPVPPEPKPPPVRPPEIPQAHNLVPAKPDEPPPHGEDTHEWANRLFRNRVLSSYFRDKITPPPTETHDFFTWVYDTAGSLAKDNKDHEILKVDGAKLLGFTLQQYTQTLEFYHQAEQRGDDRKADYWLVAADTIRELASQPEFGLRSDCDFVRDLLLRTDGFNVDKYAARMQRVTGKRIPEPPPPPSVATPK